MKADDRVEKSAEAFREQIFNGMCVPEVSDQLQPISFLILRSYFVVLLRVVHVQVV